MPEYTAEQEGASTGGYVGIIPPQDVHEGDAQAFVEIIIVWLIGKGRSDQIYIHVHFLRGSYCT